VLREQLDKDLALHLTILKDELDRSCESISISLDGWTANNNKAFLAVIGHWITSDFQLKSAVLCFKEI